MMARRTSGSYTPERSSTPIRGASVLSPADREPRLALRVMMALAVLQGLFFLLPLSKPFVRLSGIALALAVFLAARLFRDPLARCVAAVSVVSLLILGNFVAHLVLAAPNYPFRVAQLTILLAYVALLIAGVLALALRFDFWRAWLACAAVAVLALIGESVVGGSEGFSPTAGRVEWSGPVVQDSVFGKHFAPGSLVRSLYPDNPRGYFDEPDALQRRWALSTAEGSKAELQFPKDKPGVLRVAITDAPGRVRWHIALNQAPLRVMLDERYELRFRARADSVRGLIVGVGQAHEPYETIGLFRELRLDTTWREFTQSFRATGSDRNARLFFEFGADAPTTELSNVVLRAISNDKVVQAEARREQSVSYQINRLGCRGTDVPDSVAAKAWRILALGDGSTFGVGVHEGDTYSARLQALLNEPVGGHPVETRAQVMNCGVNDLTPAAAPRILDAVASSFSPNVVVYSAGLTDAMLNFGADASGGSRAKGQGLGALFRLGRLVSSSPSDQPTGADIPAIIESIKQTDAAARARGAQTVVMLFQHRRNEFWSGLDSAVVKNFPSGLPILKLGPALLPFGESSLVVHTVFDWHPSELAHRIAAEALRKFLADQGMLGDVRGAMAVDTTRGGR